MKFRINVIGKLSTLLLAVFLSLITAELSVRFLAPYSYSLNLLTYNPYERVDYDRITDLSSLHQAAKCATPPGFLLHGFVTNSHGFLTPEHTVDKLDKIYRIELIGDSFAVGEVPYPYSFIRLTETQLNNQRLPKNIDRVEAVNLGISCIGTGIERKILEIEGLKYQPNLVIVSFFVGNDFSDDVANLKHIDENHIGQLSENSYSWIYQSKLISLAKNYYTKLRTPDHLALASSARPGQVLGSYTAQGVDAYDPFAPTMTKDDYLNLTSQRLGLFFRNSWDYQNLDLVKHNIITMKNLAHQAGADFLVVVIPDELQLNQELLAESHTRSVDQDKTLDLQLPQKIISQILSESGIAYIDVLPKFLSHPNPASLYQPQDSHLNRYGNQVVASELTHYITQLLSQ